jgi:hypothetical protein
VRKGKPFTHSSEWEPITSCAGASLSTWSAFFCCSTVLSLSRLCVGFLGVHHRGQSLSSLRCYYHVDVSIKVECHEVCVYPPLVMCPTLSHTQPPPLRPQEKTLFGKAHHRTRPFPPLSRDCGGRRRVCHLFTPFSFCMAFAWMRVIITLSNWHFWLEDGEKRCLFLTTLSSMGSRMKRVYYLQTYCAIGARRKKKKKKKKSYYLNKGRVCATPGLKGVRLFVISPLVLLLLRLYLFWGEEVPRRADQQGPGGKSCRCLRLVSFSIFPPTTTATL